MCESHEEKISLATDLLNTFLSFDGHIKYEALFDYVDDNRGDEDILGVAVQATIDSSMYHEVSPNYDKNYYVITPYMYLLNKNDGISLYLNEYAI